MAELTRVQKKEWAQMLYVKENLSQKAIAEKVKVSQKTMGDWIKKGKWESLKSSITLTKTVELARFHRQLKELNDSIENKPEGQRYPSKAEVDVISQLKDAIKAFEGNASITSIIDVSIELLQWYEKIDFAKSRELSFVFDLFIKSKLK